nr:MAG TPA: cysteine sulfinate desulfinase/cysteine desulfurase [Caudoviricetes sp.]
MVYLDYAATYPYVKYPSSAYGPFLNPNTNYAYKEKRLLAEAENRVKKAIGAKSGKVVFGGTSSQLIENLMNRAKRNTVICSSYEHNSFYRYAYDSVKNISELSKNIANMPENYGKMIVMWQAVQNITGEIFPTKQIGELIHKYNGFYICDGTAQVGHTPIEPNIDDWCDFYAFSGHKIGTELGVGCCWVSDRLDKWLNGFKLYGTPNLAGALAMTQAVEDACDSRKLGQNMIHYGELLDHLIDGLVEKNVDFQLIPEYEDNEPYNKFALAINAIPLPGFNADALQQYLAFKQIYVSIGGSACAEKHDYRVLNAYGLSNDEASEVIRVSFGEDSSVEDVGALVEGIKEFRDTYVK